MKDTAISFEYEIPSVESFETRMENIMKKYPYYVAKENGKILGYCYATEFRSRAAYQYNVETTVYLHPEAKRKGIGKRLYRIVIEDLQKRGFKNAYACITGDNEESIKFHEALGLELNATFHKCGFNFTQWHYVVFLELFFLSFIFLLFCYFLLLFFIISFFFICPFLFVFLSFFFCLFCLKGKFF